MSAREFPVTTLREQFPALRHAGSDVFFDNAAGAQVPDAVIEAVKRHLIEHNVQRGGRYPRSMAVDDMIWQARQHVAAFVNARRPEEIAFGLNAHLIHAHREPRDWADARPGGTRSSSLTSTMRRTSRRGLRWSAWARRYAGGPCGRTVACIRTICARAGSSDPPGRLYPDFQRHRQHRRCTRGGGPRAHAGAEIFLDAVHYGPHGIIDVQAFDCDYLVCSGYKIFSPHMGFLWGRYEALLRLPSFREDFIPDEPPGKLEAGTFVYENVAGMAAAIDYLAQWGARDGPRRLARRELTARGLPLGHGRDPRLRAGPVARVVADVAGLRCQIYGLREEDRVRERVPTVCFNLPGSPRGGDGGRRGGGHRTGDGHMYSPRLMRRLGLAVETGAVRVSLVHYNTLERCSSSAQCSGRRGDDAGGFRHSRAGAIGSILAAHLARAGHSVVVIARGERASAVARDGLRIKGLADFTVPVTVIAEPTQLQAARP